MPEIRTDFVEVVAGSGQKNPILSTKLDGALRKWEKDHPGARIVSQAHRLTAGEHFKLRVTIRYQEREDEQ